MVFAKDDYRLGKAGHGSYSGEYHNTYYWHTDHLGSAQLITDWQGNEYRRIEYTPYGEAWIEKAETTEYIDESLPYRFTGKELDEETGLYYYGARYLDPKYSVWTSADPALGDYLPAAGADISNLPGMGGVFNTVNMHLYHYAGNNPVRYVDPNGMASILQRTINDNETDKYYHYAHIIGEKTGIRITLHGLVDFGDLGGFSKNGSVSQYSGKISGFTDNDRGSKTNKYIIVYTGMDDSLTEKAVKNVLQLERFGGGDNELAKKKYSIFTNDCNSYTTAVFYEYKKLWKEQYRQDNPNAWEIKVKFEWFKHYLEITERQGESYEEK